MSGSIGQQAFQLAFECSPIVFVNGLAQNIPGQMLPIIAITEAASFIGGILSGGTTPDLGQFFAHFFPLPGATLAEWQIGEYPFANQAVAANALIAQPLSLSMLMRCPPQPSSGGWATKLVTMTALQAAVAAHNAAGGTYTVITPSYFYTNLILTALRDISHKTGGNPQDDWQWDFRQPLLTLNQAQSVQSSLMSKLSSGTAIDGQPSWTGLSPTLGNPNTVQAPSILPSAGSAAPLTAPNTTGFGSGP